MASNTYVQVYKRGIIMAKVDIKKTNIIKTSEDWFKFAPPEGGKKQWAAKHSALELANYFTAYGGNLPPEIEDTLRRNKIKVFSFQCEPECVTSFPAKSYGTGTGRHHDLLMVGKDCVVGIEAKATETLDLYVDEKHKGTTNHKARYDGIAKDLFGKTVAELGDIRVRYQLMSATIGTLIEAKKRNLSKAEVLVILFSSDITTREHIDNTKNDMDTFISLLERNKDGSYRTPYDQGIKLYVDFTVVEI